MNGQATAIITTVGRTDGSSRAAFVATPSTMDTATAIASTSQSVHPKGMSGPCQAHARSKNDLAYCRLRI